MADDSIPQPRTPELADFAKGAVAGAVGALVKYGVTSYLYAHEDADARKREDEARGKEHAYEIMAGRAAERLGRPLDKTQKAVAGQVAHWTGNVAGMGVYGLARARYPRIRKAGGLAVGLPVTLAMDEIGNPLTGVTPGPTAFPWQTHARAVVGQAALWLTAEGTMRALDAVWPPSTDGAAGPARS